MEKKQYDHMSQLKLPFKSSDGSFCLTELNGRCNECGGELRDLRGHIFESFDVIEMTVAGFCKKCGKLIGCRNRVYLKTGEFAEEHDGGWERVKMSTFHEIWGYHTAEKMRKMVIPMILAMMASMFFLGLTINLLIALVFVICTFAGLSVLLSWFSAKKLLK